MKRLTLLVILLMAAVFGTYGACAEDAGSSAQSSQKLAPVHGQESPDLSRNVIIVGNKKFYPLKGARHYSLHPVSPLLPRTSPAHGVRVIRPHKTETTSTTPDVLKSPEVPEAPSTPATPTPPSSPIVQGVTPEPPSSHSPATAKDVLSLFEPDEPPIKH